MNIEISLHSQKLIKKYLVACGISHRAIPNIDSSVDLESLLSWLNDEQIKLPIISKRKRKKIEYILVSLRAELLRDLFASMKGDQVKVENQDKNTVEMSKIKFSLLTAAGILVAACQGFDGIVTMLSVFTMPSIIILSAGIAFSILSIVVFCGVDLVKVSNNLGVKLSDTYKLLDAYLLQLENIKAIRKKIDNYNLAGLSQNDFKRLEQILSMLEKRHLSLTEAGKQFDEALHSESLQRAKTLITGVSALLFFGGGFFAGQSVALFVASLVVNSTIPAFWPVIIFSSIVGMAALSIYWYVERPGVKKLVTSWFGLNEEDVHKLCDNDLVTKEARKLDNLKGKVISMAKLAKRLTALEQAVGVNEVVNDEVPIHYTANEGRVSANFYSFLKPQSELTSISLEQHDSADEVAICCTL